ncbi:maleylpyruvate isomerase N-terminal domain-containing protein [Promicromonospora sp. NPDC057138]|uniref:maleylpyruvate isomerase N-terminal domain-containing protein n=1 Tax=Promicromonospora sp. NPDC057138 TaxID=3346031 RepID=UPI00364358B4
MSLDHLALLARFQRDFLAAVPDADADARVPACGDWTVRELVEHLADVHHWAAGQARGVKGAPLGAGPFDLAPHYAAQAAELRETLAGLAPDAVGRVMTHPKPMGPGPARFWHRRQTHETLVHLHDLLAASAGAGSLGLVRAEPEVWADTVDEVVTVLQPRQVGLGRMEPLRHPVSLVATDVAGTPGWVLGAPGERAEEVAPDVVVSGPAEGLALTLWRRLTPAEAGLTVKGDRADLEAALGQAIVP